MTDISSLRRKLMYRSWYRGCKETDILLGRFALEYLDKLSLNELIEYEKIVDLDDYELYCYITRKVNLPPNINSKIMSLITCFIEDNPLSLMLLMILLTFNTSIYFVFSFLCFSHF